MISLLYQILLLVRALGLKKVEPRTATMITSTIPMKVNMDNLLTRICADVFNKNLIYLSMYRYQRSQMYPGVGYKPFTDYKEHKIWMIAETRKFSRMERNKAVIEKYRPKPKHPY